MILLILILHLTRSLLFWGSKCNHSLAFKLKALFFGRIFSIYIYLFSMSVLIYLILASERLFKIFNKLRKVFFRKIHFLLLKSCWVFFNRTMKTYFADVAAFILMQYFILKFFWIRFLYDCNIRNCLVVFEALFLDYICVLSSFIVINPVFYIRIRVLSIFVQFINQILNLFYLVLIWKLFVTMIQLF